MRIVILRDSLMACVNKEKDVSPIITGCYDAIVKGLASCCYHSSLEVRLG
jgi:hypothetical protein